MWNCKKVLRYVAPPESWAKVGKYVKYSAAEVLRRRAARYTLVTVCTLTAGGGGVAGASLLPPAWLGLPERPPVATVVLIPPPVFSLPPAPRWRDTGLPVHNVPEPATLLLLGSGFALILLFRKQR